jgi:hypothetical protein
MDDPGNDLWGLNSCRPKCGNGIVDPPYPAASGVGYFTEQCDLKTYNSDGDVYANSCSTRCQKKGITPGVDLHLWTCTVEGTGRNAKSLCVFNCGNKVLDNSIEV